MSLLNSAGSDRPEPLAAPEPRLKLNDKVVLRDHPVRWGFGLDFDLETVFTIISKPILIHVGGSPKWTAVVDHDGVAYEIYEESLGPVG